MLRACRNWCRSSVAREQVLQDVVFHRLHGAGLDQRFRFERHAVSFVDLHSQFDGRDGSEARISQRCGDVEVAGAHNGGHHFVDVGLKDVHGRIHLLWCCGLLFGLGQRTLVDLHVLVERDGIDLHGHGRHHVGWFLIENKGVERINVDGFVAHHIGCDELAAAFFVKGLHGGIFDVGELTNDAFHLF